MPLSDDAKFEVLHQHYQDTFVHIQQHLRIRDRHFFIIVGLLVLSAFQLFSPSDAPGLLSEWIQKQLDVSKPVSVDFLGSAIWFLLLGALIRYYQVTIHIELQYEYIHTVEEELSSHWSSNVFTREGKSYNANYPWFSHFVHWAYQLAFPILLLTILGMRFRSDCLIAGGWNATIVFNLFVFLSILASTVLYLIKLHFNK